MNDHSEIPRGVRFTLEEAARTGKASAALDRNAFPRGVRPALAEAARTARAAKRTFTTAGWLIAGGPLGLSVVAATVGGDWAWAFAVVLFIGVPVALTGLCVLPLGFALRAKAKKK